MLMEGQISSGEEEGSREKGLLYRWQGYSCNVTFERLGLSRPVLHAALGALHGLLLTEGSFGEQPWKQESCQPVSPVLESSLSGQHVISVSAGSYHCSAITENGLVHMWGENSYGQCGISGMDHLPNPTPVSVVDDESQPYQLVRIQNVSCGAQHTLALSGKHEVWAWGSGCQLGLVTNVFPVWKPQKVEHLVGRYVVQIACGGFHSLALVEFLSTPEACQHIQDRCGQCKQSLYTMTDKDDHAIISDGHYCPLGVELADSKQGSGKSSPAQMLQTKHSTSDCQESLWPENFYVNQQSSSQENSENPVGVTEIGRVPLGRTKSKNTAYPDEQALKDYLKRISDAEQAEAASLGGSSALSRQRSLTHPFRSDIFDESIMLPASPTTDDVTHLAEQVKPSHLLPLGDSSYNTFSQDSSVDGGFCISDLVISNRCLFESCEQGGEAAGLDLCLTDTLQSKKSISLNDIFVEDSGAHDHRGSLPSILSPASPSDSHRISYARAVADNRGTSEHKNLLPSLYTEVWSWGSGQEGQLGHGDHLPRLQPLCIKSLSKKEVVKITAGENHSLALTAQCQVSDGIRVWDIAAGHTHTLLLADGDFYQPILYYTGEQVMWNADSSHPISDTYTQTPTLLPFSMEIGYVSQVFSGGLNCLALADQNAMGFIATVHELASAERKFYCTLSKVKSQILAPLLRPASLALCLGPSSMLLFQEVAGRFSKLWHLTGQHSTSLTNFLQRGKVIKTLAYSDPVGNFLVMGGFQSLLKPLQESFGKKLELIHRLVESKENNLSPCELLVTLFYSPLQHLHGYNRLLLKLANCFDVRTEEYQWIHDGSSKYEALARLLSKQRKDAESTFNFWKNFRGKRTESLRKPSRRLICQSGNKSLTLHNAGRFSASCFILFNDVLVHAQFSSHFVYPLATLWVEPISEESEGILGLKLTTPEDSFVVLASSPLEKGKWLRAINKATDDVLTAGLNGKTCVSSGRQTSEPPVSRTAAYSFIKEGRLKDTSYDGRWLSGKPHGKGILKWPDGTVYCGTFKNGLQDGFGDYMTPNSTFNKFERYQGHWKEGKINGFGTYWYASSEVYEGSFKENLRHGHGMLRSGKMASPSSSSVYVGQWVQGKKTGYGVCDDFSRGEKYMGIWLDDQRHGDGLVITQSGLYYEGSFCNNKMMGDGTLLSDDDTVFKGEFSDDWTLYGKGVLSIPNGDSLDGTFDGRWGTGLRVAGIFTKPFETLRTETNSLVDGFHSVPAEEKWNALFEECWSRLGCEKALKNLTPGQGVFEKAWENIAISLTARRSQQKDRPEELSRSQNKMLESLEVIPKHVGPVTADSYNNIRRYLMKACDTPLHPLGWLMENLVTVYRMTYVGVGSSRRLLQQAVEELHSFLTRIFKLVRFLFPTLPEDGGFILDSSSSSDEFTDSLNSSTHSETPQEGLIVSSSNLLLPVLLPRLYPPLFTLYTLEKEREEEVYWSCVLRLNKQPDLALLAFLGVQHTAFTPLDKLQVLQLTFEEVTQDVKALLGQEFLWCMDDLFPIFLFVVLRARIRNLGSEVCLIEDLTDCSLQLGQLGFMLTTLKACYNQIQLEKTT
ncbi:Alsin Amyotrophic lateral sclerosis 2 protein -like protein [Triplophysa tibetana]|uniref:Alsin Amyotrophic lateral sclerosis 2 protein-like protein n=1 Tax=Triplophysa tibetana TaxID=1572043 RepID=A0A5A9P498_9TELE|nr:Alsin Amyotrophic lateral sclerosis 2 protein -like protein [Triplophysa tibetana]